MTTCRDQDFLEGADEGTSKSLEPQKTRGKSWKITTIVGGDVFPHGENMVLDVLYVFHMSLALCIHRFSHPCSWNSALTLRNEVTISNDLPILSGMKL